MRLFKKLLGLLLLGLLGNQPAVANSAQALQQRLNRVKQFSAQFVQTVTDAQGERLQQSQGKLWLQRPARFRWQTTTPDEQLIVSDGQTLWLYTPSIQQVTAMGLTSALENSPFVLISSNQAADWQRYQIRQQGDHFTLLPKAPGSGLHSLTIRVTPQGIIQQFCLVDQAGQHNQFVLQKLQRRSIPQQLFTFKLPPGAALDDQR